MKEELLEYINKTPYNTNPAIVKQFLNSDKQVKSIKFGSWAEQGGTGHPMFYKVTIEPKVLQEFYDSNAIIVLCITGIYNNGPDWRLADYCFFKNIKDNTNEDGIANIKADEELKKIFVPRNYEYIENPTLRFGVDKNGKIKFSPDDYYWYGPAISSLSTEIGTIKELFAIY